MILPMLRRLGSAKYKIVRVFAYIAIVNLAILVQVNGWQWWYLVVPPIFGLLYWFESRYGIPGELDIAWAKSREWQEYKIEFQELQNEVKLLGGSFHGKSAGGEQQTPAEANKEVPG